MSSIAECMHVNTEGTQSVMSQQLHFRC